MRRVVLVIGVVVAGCGDDTGGFDASPSPWLVGPTLPDPRLEPGVAAVGGRLAMIGGFDGALAIVSTGWALDLAGGTWTALPDAPVAWTHLGLAGKGGVLFLLGGLEGTDYIPRGDAFVLDATAPAWQPLPAMPAGLERGAAGIAVGPNLIYVVGGATQTDAIASVLAYDVAAMTWAELPPLPAARSHPAAFALSDGSLIVAGGLATLDASQPQATTWRLTAGAPAWVALAPLPAGAERGGCATAILGARLICAGGEAGTQAIARVDAYDVASDTWTRLEDMPEPRAGTQGVAIGGRMYVPGGANRLAFDPEDSLAVYAPP